MALPLGELSPKVTERALQPFLNEAARPLSALSVLAALGHLSHRERQEPLSLSKSLAEFAPAGAKKLKSVFSGDMRVGKNTHRPANVRAGR